MKEIAIATLFQKFPDVHFTVDLHDATFSLAPESDLKEIETEMLQCLNDIDYSKYWGFELPCPLTYESGSGKSFRDIK
jgi:hypothetical protein